MTEIVEKLFDIALGVLISVTCIMFITGRPMLDSKKADKQHSEAIAHIQNKVQEIADNQASLQKALSLLVGQDTMDVAIKLEQVEKLGENNRKLLADISGIIVNSPEKVLGLKQINMDMAVLNEKVKDIKTAVDKNSDRLVNNLQSWSDTLLTILIAVISLKLVFLRKSPQPEIPPTT